MHEIRRRRRPVTQLVCLFAILVLAGAWYAPNPARAAEDQSYQAMVNWLEHYREAPPTFEPGQTLGLQDRKALEPFIPQSAWDYYFFDDMEMADCRNGRVSAAARVGPKRRARLLPG